MIEFYSHFQITPIIREFCDVNNDSNHQSSNIEEESELTKFAQALQEAQIIALKEENKNKRGVYSKHSKKTLKHHEEVQVKLASEGFLSIKEYMQVKGLPIKQNKLAPE